MATDRPRRPRPGGGPRKRPSSGGGSRGRSGGAPRSGGTPRSGGARRGGPTKGRGGPARPPRREAPQPRTEAERRAAEVRARRGPRTPIDPEQTRQRIEQRETVRFVDEGPVTDAGIRAEAAAATARAGGARPRRPHELDPEVLAEIRSAAADPRRAERITERLASAAAALDRERYGDVRRMVAPVIREMPQIAAAHELNGLAAYRTGRWRQAVASLEQARELRPDPALLPVLADSYRALKRWPAVEAVWRQIREASPSHEVMAEGRIVAAGALADRGELKQAITLMQAATKPPKKVREHHLRQWYVLADLLDRAGDTVGAARWFREVMTRDPDFADVRERLRALGR